MSKPYAIAVGRVHCSPNDPGQTFTLWLIAENEVELRLDNGEILTIEIGSIGGHEIAEAIELKTSLAVQFDYARSRLTWSGGLRPISPPTGPLRTKRMPLPRRTLRSS